MISTEADPLPSWNGGPATINNPPPSPGTIVHHTDGEREYDGETKSTGKLVEAIKEAPERGWLIVDMKQDWKAIFGPAE